MKRLTKREEEVMQVIWELDRAFVNDIIPKLSVPDLPYTTISSIVRILEKKGYVDYKAYGKTHEYFPIVSREEYRKSQMKSFVKSHFDSSYKSVVSFFAENQDISSEELKEILDIIENRRTKSDD